MHRPPLGGGESVPLADELVPEAQSRTSLFTRDQEGPLSCPSLTLSAGEQPGPRILRVKEPAHFTSVDVTAPGGDVMWQVTRPESSKPGPPTQCPQLPPPSPRWHQPYPAFDI